MKEMKKKIQHFNYRMPLLKGLQKTNQLKS